MCPFIIPFSFSQVSSRHIKQIECWNHHSSQIHWYCYNYHFPQTSLQPENLLYRTECNTLNFHQVTQVHETGLENSSSISRYTQIEVNRKSLLEVWWMTNFQVIDVCFRDQQEIENDEWYNVNTYLTRSSTTSISTILVMTFSITTWYSG